MKKILLILMLTISSSVVIAAGSAGGDSKNTASKGVKAATKFEIGKNGYLKQKIREKK